MRILLCTLIVAFAALSADAQQVTWKRSATGYTIYRDSKPANNTISAYMENDLLVYDSVSTVTFVLPGFKTAVYDSLYTGKVAGSGSDQYFWRTKDKLYWIYNRGMVVSNTKANWADNNMLVYEPVSNTTFLFRDYGSAPPNTIFTAEKISTQDTEIWRTKDGSYWLYSKGAFVGNTNSFWFGNDLVVYDTVANKSYWFKDYKFADPNKFYVAYNLATSNHIFWWQKDGSYWIYHNGKDIEDPKSFWHENNLVIYDPATGISYLLTNYKNNTDWNLNQGEILSTTESIWWFGDAENYWLYDQGEVVEEASFKNDGNDLIVIGTNGKEYVVANFYTVKDMILRPVKLRN